MSNETSVTDQELTEWISSALENESIKNIEIISRLKSSLGDGFGSGIDFVRVAGVQKGSSIQLDLVVKNGRQGEIKRRGGVIRSAFKRELYIYDKVLPRLQQLELEKNIKNRFTAFPKLYKGLIFDDNEVLVFENLKAKGYKLNINQPMNWEHRDFLLKEYAKYHALNFALRDQYYEEFKKLAEPVTDIMEEFFKNDGGYEFLLKNCEEYNQIYKKWKKQEILDKVGDIGKKEIHDLFFGDQSDCEPYSIIIHADNWNNNFMFKYSGTDDQSPENVSILDWQISLKASPICDIIKFFYCNSKYEEYDNYEKFIDIYYQYLSLHLKALGSDPDKMFPKNLAKQHWKQFAKKSYLLIPWLIKIRYADKSTMKENDDFGEMSQFGLTNREEYENYVVKISEHFIKHSFI